MDQQSLRFNFRHTLVILLLGGTIWALLLRFFFPGYFDPFVPFHVDHFVYLGNSAEGYGLSRYLYFYPRPLGNLLFDLMGRLGTRGMLVPVFLLALVNGLLFIRYVERVTGRMVSAFGIALFFLLCFANPQSYSSVKEDILAVVCVFGLLLIFHLWHNYSESGGRGNLIAIIVIAFLSSYVKETYFAVIALFFLLQSLFNRGHRIASIALLLITTVIAIISLIVNGKRGPFVHIRALPTDPYYQDWSPASVLHGYLHLLSFLIFPASALLVLAALVFLAWNSRKAFVCALVSVLFVCAIFFPHTLLRNHLEDQYAWLGAFFLFTPILFADVFLRRWRIPILAGVTVAAALSMQEYHKSGLQGMAAWLREQEQLQQTFLASWTTLKATGQSAEHNLVIGPTMPYQPFTVPGFILKSFGPDRHWTVVLPDAMEKKKSLTTEIIHASDLSSLDYDRIFVFNPDGRLIGLHAREQARAISQCGGFRGIAGLTDLAVE